MSLFESFTRREQDATNVSMSPSGHVTVDFADVMKTSQFGKLRDESVRHATLVQCTRSNAKVDVGGSPSRRTRSRRRSIPGSSRR